MLVPGSGSLGAYRLASRQPMRSGATCSAGRAEEGVGEVLGERVAMGVALDEVADAILLPTK